MPQPMIADRAALMDGLALAAREAGAAIMAIFDAGFEVMHKADASPVTAADCAAEAIILKALQRLAPDVPVVAEEEAAAGRIPDVQGCFFLVDPLDGTKEFVRRGTDFTVNIGLIEGGTPTLGVVYAPARGTLYVGDVTRGVAWRVQDGETDKVALKVRTPADPPVAVASKSHDTPQTEAYLTLCKCGKRVSIGSSLKFCLLADGEADFYPRPAPTYEWDTAAGQAVLDAAGGAVYDLEGAPFRYGKPNFYNPGFLAVGGLRDLPTLGSCQLKACG
ncbi:MAG: 3'(2'),5'-bisphosphate nucleotidase CysQ [Caulobacteraceae bacterium]